MRDEYLSPKQLYNRNTREILTSMVDPIERRDALQGAHAAYLGELDEIAQAEKANTPILPDSMEVGTKDVVGSIIRGVFSTFGR